MSFGFGVGDFIVVAELVNKIRGRFVGSPGQFKAIATEVRSLSIVLLDANIDLPQRELTSQQKTERDGIVQGCCDLLKELESTLDKYQELDSGSKISNVGPRRVWKRLTWDQTDIDGLRGRISSNIALLGRFLNHIDSQTIFEVKDSVDRLDKRHQEQRQNEERQIIIDWLSPSKYDSQHSDIVARHHEGTGQWLLNSDKFQNWLNKDKKILFCPGMPGAGKTMIASIAIGHLYAAHQTDSSIGIAYLYCNFQLQDEQKPIHLLASLLKRLLERRPTLPDSTKDLYECHRSKQTRPSLREISKELQSVIASFSITFIVIDALDECQLSDGDEKSFLSEILGLQANTRASLFVTSRPIPRIEKQFQGCASLKIRASEEDVDRYINGRMQCLPSFVQKNPDMQKEIKTEIVKAVDGMFLLAKLYLGSLMGKKSPKALREALKRLPSGSEAYDYAYKEAMERINDQDADSQELAKQALGWITCSKRPLTTLELQHALAVKIGQPSLDEENLPEIEDVISVCAGLVTVDEGSGVIRLVHYTTQEYFDRNWTSWFCNAQRDIGETCVTYLLFNTFKSGFCPTHNEFEARLRKNPLYEYAAKNWAHHACAGSIEEEELILDFLQNDAVVSASSQVLLSVFHTYGEREPSEIRGVHLAAYFGLVKAMTALLKKGHHPDSKVSSRSWTPLSWAVANGHEAMVELLLATAGVDTNSVDDMHLTPLCIAAHSGQESTAKLLLATASVNVNSKDFHYGATPLSWAIGYGQEALVKLLLSTANVDINARSLTGSTPLFEAASFADEVFVKLLVTTAGIDLNSKNIMGETPLSAAARRGRVEIVRLLLATAGVDVNSKNNAGETPLSIATRKGSEVKTAGMESLMDRIMLMDGDMLMDRDRDKLMDRDRYKDVVKLLESSGAKIEETRGESGP